jgi:uncharacterized protein
MLELTRDQDLKNLLEQARTIAVIGAKDKPGQPVDNVGRYLMKAGYRVVPVHPKRQNVWGLETWKSILDIPFPFDIIDLFRAADYCPNHALEVLELNYTPMCFWMQLGISSGQAVDMLKHKPIIVIQDKCLKIEHQRLLGG